jgi:glutaredoxin
VLIEVYTKPDCPLCDTAKRMLNEKKLSFHEIVIGRDITREEVLEKFPEARVAPVISIDGRMVREATEFQLLVE